MRPGEVTIMRGIDLDMSGRVWVYRPERHKNQNRDIEREIFLGPKAQAIIKSFLKPDLTAYLFSPTEAREERFRLLRSNRQTKVQPSQANRKKKNPEEGQEIATPWNRIVGPSSTAATQRSAAAWSPRPPASPAVGVPGK